MPVACLSSNRAVKAPKFVLSGDAEKKGLEAGLSVADVVFPQTRPEKVERLGLWQ